MPREHDLSTADYLRWAVDRPGIVRTVCATPALDKAARSRFRASVMRSRAVSFDAEASAALGEIANQDPGALDAAAEFARWPWESAIVTVDRMAFMGSVGQDSHADPGNITFLIERDGGADRVRVTSPFIDPESDARIVTLGPIVYTALGGADVPARKETDCMRTLRPMAQQYADERLIRVASKLQIPDDEVVARLIAERDVIDLYLMGRGFLPSRVNVSEVGEPLEVDIGKEFAADAVRLAQRLSAHWMPGINSDLIAEKQRDLGVALVAETIGGPRIALAIMVALSAQFGAVVEERRARGHHMVGNRRCPYLAVTTVRLSLTPSDVRQGGSVSPGLGATRRRHPVRGFWRTCRRSGYATCSHAWHPDPVRGRDDAPERMRCRCCNSLRTWVEAHERGDGEKGFVIQNVEVVK